MLSWGYLLHRGKNLQIDLATILSRIPSRNNKIQFELENDFQANYKTDAFIVGRVIINIWRIMRYEVIIAINFGVYSKYVCTPYIFYFIVKTKFKTYTIVGCVKELYF